MQELSSMNKIEFIKRYITRQTASGPQWHTIYTGPTTITSSNATAKVLATNLGLTNGQTIRYRISLKCTKGSGYFSVSQFGENKTSSGSINTEAIYEGDLTASFATSAMSYIIRVYTDTNSSYQAGNNIRVYIANNNLYAQWVKYTNSSANYSITMTINSVELLY